MKYYIMTSLSRRDEHNYVREQLNALGHEITCDWTVPLARFEDPYKSRMDDDLLTALSIREVEGVRDADFCVALLPGGRGTHTEFGMALAWDKPLIVHDAEDLLAPGRNRTSFYVHPGVQVWLKGDLDFVANYVRDYPWSGPQAEGRWTLGRSAYGRVGLGWFVEAHEDARGEWSLKSEDVAEGGYFASVWFKPDGSIDELDISESTMRQYLSSLTEDALRDGLLDLGRLLATKRRG